jgi:ferredoxin
MIKILCLYILIFCFQLTFAFFHATPLSRAVGLHATLTVDGKSFEAPAKANIRKIMLDNKKDVYTLKGKLGNCGGGGVCGTCAVKVLDGEKFLTPPSKNELKVLAENKKGAGIRLGCAAKMTGKGDVKIKSKAA